MRLGLLWILGVLSGVIGAAILYDARPGLNWGAWTAITAAGLLAYRRPDRATLRALALPLGFAVILAAGAGVTTTPILLVAILLIVASLLALTLLVAPDDPTARDYGAVEIITAPLRGLAQTVRGIVTAIGATVARRGTSRERPVLRGSLIAAPVVIALILLFAAADPVLARGRDFVYDAISTFSDVPRIGFFLLLTLIVVGAYAASHMVMPRAATRMGTATPGAVIGLTERRIVLGAAGAVSWLFVILQMSYLFGTPPSLAGSGFTYAEYARRGFGELAVAATGVALLIVAAHQRIGPDDEPRERRGLMWPSLALLAAVYCILVSAFHRVSLYEDAYGYTTARVYAQAYMILTLVILAVLTWQVLRVFDVRVLARATMTVALATLTVIVFWNADAWVANANLDRYAQTGKIDVVYLARGLSPDAYPVLVQSLPRLALPERTQLVLGLAKQYARQPSLRAVGSWYEWNLRRSRARSALGAAGISAHAGTDLPVGQN